MTPDLLGIGITGTTLTDLERRIIHDTSPYAVVLFGRNVESVSQLRDLIAEVKSIAPRPPLMMIDEEGGRVDRLRSLLPGLPSAEAFGEGEEPREMAAWLGRIIGMALRFFEIEIDLAPVVDIRAEESPKGLERRTFGHDAEMVVDLAGAFVRGLHASGVAACLKHFPGIGMGSADPHYGATVIDASPEELTRRDLVPFERLGNEAGAIMIGHGTYSRIDPGTPATLSRRITTELLRNGAGFRGAAITDDMEMHAVSDLGTYEEIADRALMAGNDVILFCSHIERVHDLQRHLDERVARGGEFAARHAEAVDRADRYREHSLRLRDSVPAVASFDQIVDEMIRFSDAFKSTRPDYEEYVGADRRHNPRALRGRTGREEWT